MSDKVAPPYAVPSASIVMIRKGAEAPELLMVKRRAGDAFGDSYAFPGGLVDPDEHFSHQYAIGRQADDVNNMLGIADGLSYYSAAIRELFEETGILLIDRNDMASQPDIQSCRRSVDCGDMHWSEFLQQHNVNMDVGALHYFSWWETPFIRPKRWSTRFFIALMPAGQEATLDGNELTDIRWLPARDILRQAHAGNMKVPFPTMRILEDFAKHSSTEAIITWADRLAQQTIEMLRPTKLLVDGKTQWVFDKDMESSC